MKRNYYRTFFNQADFFLLVFLFYYYYFNCFRSYRCTNCVCVCAHKHQTVPDGICCDRVLLESAGRERESILEPNAPARNHGTTIQRLATSLLLEISARRPRQCVRRTDRAPMVWQIYALATRCVLVYHTLYHWYSLSPVRLLHAQHGPALGRAILMHTVLSPCKRFALCGFHTGNKQKASPA